MSLNVCVLADSVMLGVTYDESRGGYRILRDGALNALARCSGIKVSSLARMGRTAPEACAVLKDTLAAGTKPDVLFVELGGNDCDMNWAQVAENPACEHLPRTPLPLFRSALKEIVRLGTAAGAKVFVSSLPPLVPARFLDWVAEGTSMKERILSFIGDTNRIYRWQELYSSAALNVATEAGAGIVNLRESFLTVKSYEELICPDGMHPNAQGHKVMGEVIKELATTITGDGTMGGFAI